MRSFTFALLFFLAIEAFALVNGVPLKNSPDVVRIKLTNGWVCSGAYIDPYTILTAAHCISPTEATEILYIDRIESEDDGLLDVKLVSLIPNPNYSAQYWHAFDVGIIKTTRNQKFVGHFQLQKSQKGYVQDAVLFGCGRIEHDKKVYFRTTGENSFIQIGAILFFIGKSENLKPSTGSSVSVAPNDSGGPILDKTTGEIVGVMTTTTLKLSGSYGVPTLSTGTSTVVEHNLSFIRNHMSPLHP